LTGPGLGPEGDLGEIDNSVDQRHLELLMIPLRKRFTAGLTALCLGLGTLLMAQPRAAADPADCTPTGTVSMFTYNDFHGRLVNAAALFTPVEKARASQGDANVALISSGDDIGGSTFESMADNDNPTLKVMAAAGLSARTVGNHEFDKGWADLAGRVNPAVPGVDQLGANVYLKGTKQVASPLKAYTTFKVGKLDVAVIGAVTGDLPSLVSPSGISDLTIGDPVDAVNETVSQLPEGIDLVIASIHEGAPNGNGTGDEQAAASPNFRKMWTGIDPRIRVVLGGHTHQTYSWTNDKGQLFTQAGSYAAALNELKAGVTGDGALCGISNTTTKIDAKAFDTSLPRIREITDIVSAAVTKADEIGAQVIGQASEAISPPMTPCSPTPSPHSARRCCNVCKRPMLRWMTKERYGATTTGIEAPSGVNTSSRQAASILPPPSGSSRRCPATTPL